MPTSKGEYVIGVCKPWPQSDHTKITPFDSIYTLCVDVNADGLTYKEDDTGKVLFVDALLLWGGEDIHSSLYGKTGAIKNQAKGEFPSNRDTVEWWAIHEAHIHNIPIIGVCRGAQILCAFAGGSLYQHVTHHNTAHKITTYSGEIFAPSAGHHQMMNVSTVEHELLAWNSGIKSTEYHIDRLLIEHFVDKEPEVVWFPKIKGLAIQPHPEWEPEPSNFNEWILTEIMERML